MAQQDLQIHVEPRKAGKIHCRKYRKVQRIPGVIYGLGSKNANFTAEEKVIKKFSSQQYENSIFTLKSEDAALNDKKILIKEIVVQPVTRRPLHVDFLTIDMNKEVRVFVELKFEGKAEGLGDGGMLQPLTRQIEVLCLPSNIPEFISVDVTPLHIGETIHLSDLTLPENVEAASQENIALVTVSMMREDEPTPSAQSATTDAAATTPATGATAPSDTPETKK